ncbi:hypothetical protein DSLASN_29410 [Desulfoluna limicola]|uniref:Uncharacterized protein n=1 Tax=Desulfoluna limicola TaxID=2810562 RepID=A0ABM7PJ49_9BACT|nr:hypothetical protein [Desulfoluna limicola]BCS97309.1 hypothetical protein DSLASN_29410 [Desulfoluna limicola]
MTQSNRHFYSGGLKGAEAAFGIQAEKYGVSETTYAFEGQPLTREMNVEILSEETLKKGDVSMEIVSARMGRRYAQADRIRKVFQVIFHMVNKGCQVLAIGWIQDDNTVKGGTGWAVELGKFFNRPVSVFDQDKNQWYTWKENRWALDTPVITEKTFCGTGTRNLSDEGKAAIEDLFKRSFA